MTFLSNHILPLLRQLVDDDLPLTDDIAALYSCVKRGMYSDTTEELRTLILKGKYKDSPILTILSTIAMILCIVRLNLNSTLNSCRGFLPELINHLRSQVLLEYELDEANSLIITLIADIEKRVNADPAGPDAINSTLNNAVLLIRAGGAGVRIMIKHLQDVKHKDVEKSRGSSKDNGDGADVGEIEDDEGGIENGAVEESGVEDNVNRQLVDDAVVRDFNNARIALALRTKSDEILAAVFESEHIAIALPAHAQGDKQPMHFLEMASKISHSEPLAAVRLFHDGNFFPSLLHSGSTSIAMLEVFFHRQPHLDLEGIRARWEPGYDSGEVYRNIQQVLSMFKPLANLFSSSEAKEVVHLTDPLIIKVCELMVQRRVDRPWEEVKALLHPELDPALVEQWCTFHTTVRAQRTLLNLGLMDLAVVSREVRFYHDHADAKSDSLGHQIYLAYIKLYSPWANIESEMTLKYCTMEEVLALPVQKQQLIEEVFNELSVECKKLLSITTIDDLPIIKDYIQHYCI